MKKLKYVFMVMAVAFVAVITLISCSKATKSYSDKINNAYQSGEAITYDDVLKELGNEAINLTKNGESGVILVVSGMTSENYKDKVQRASDTEKFDIVAITVVQRKCTYAHFSTGTKADIEVSIMASKTN